MGKKKGEAETMEKFSELQYVRPDMEKVLGDMRAVTEALKNAADFGEFKAAYMDYVNTDIQVSTARQLAHIRNTINMMDEFYEAEMGYFHAWMPKYEILIKEMGTVILNSPFKKDMEEEFGSILIQNMEVGQLLSSEAVVDDMVKEAELANLYSKTVAGASVEFRGEMCSTYGLLKHMQSTDRQERKEAFEAWARLFEGISPKIDEIYDGLVQLRAGMAQKLGFESFIPMGYYKRRRYDYNAEDLKVFRRQVQEVIVPACVKLYERQRKALGVDTLHYYDESISSPQGNPVPVGDRDYMVKKAQEMYRELSPESGEFFDFMVEHQLFDLETKKGKRVGGYCTSLPLYHAPFIFSNFNGTSGDVDVLTHEAGHAFADFIASQTVAVRALSCPTMEGAETHSMSMEFLTAPWHHLFFGELTDKYELSHAEDALLFIPYGCLVDHFQEEVYRHPEMTPQERNQVWLELEKRYRPYIDFDNLPFYSRGAGWQRQLHIYLYPFYYIDYCMAQVMSLQYFALSLEDRSKAWEKYMAFVRQGGTKTFVDLAHSVDLRSPIDQGCVKDVCQAAFQWTEGHLVE